MTEQSQLGPSTDGSVMIDIGGDVGALILHTGAELLLAEIDISRLDGARPLAEGFEMPGEHVHTHGAGEHAHSHSHADAGGPPRTHVAVRERQGADGSVRYAAIYPGLYSGEYQLWRPDGTPGDVLTIVGGTVTEIDWQ